jgi:hypothetical protein
MGMGMGITGGGQGIFSHMPVTPGLVRMGKTGGFVIKSSVKGQGRKSVNLENITFKIPYYNNKTSA